MAWPILLSAVADFTAGPPNLPGVNQVSLLPSVEVKGFQTGQGRQYEMGTAEAGTLTLNIDDPNEVLSPLNSGSAWNQGSNSLLPYRGVQVGAYLNPAATPTVVNGVVTGLTGALTGNLLNASNWAPGQPWLGTTYGYDPSFENWSIQTTQSSGGSSVVTGLPAGALNANTGFESGISPWTISGGTVVQSSTQKHSGSFSAQVTPSGSAFTVDLTSELVAVVPGRQYTVTGWVWVTTAVTSGFVFGAGFWDSGNNAVSFVNATLTSIPATTWTQVTATFTAPATAAFVAIHNQLTNTPPASNVFYLDDVSITNFAAPADGTKTVSVVSLNSATDRIHWTPRFVPGQSYTFTVDVWAPTGLVITVGWFGAVFATTTITGNNAYQTATLSFTTTAADSAAPISYLYVQAASAGSYPQSVYVANYTINGLQPGWTLTAGAAMGYTQIVAQAGSYSDTFNLNSATDSASLVMPTVPGQQYTFSAYVYIQNTGTGLSATQTIGSNTQTLSTATTWTRLSNTFTATAATTTVVWKGTTSAYPAKIYVDCVQLELAATASTFTLTGPVFDPVFTGWIERYPQQWSTMGRRGMRPLTGVDALSPLSRVTPETSYRSVILADSPSAFAPLNDAALPQIVQLPQGGFNAQGYTSLGTNGQVSFQGDTFLDGTSAVSVAQQNATPPTSGNPAYVTYLGTSNLSVPMNPQSFTLEMWVNVTSGTPYLGAAAILPGENPNTEAVGPQQWVGLYTLAGKIFGHYADASGAGFNYGPPGGWSGYPDGNWHYVAIVLPGSNNVHLYADGVGGGIGTFSGGTPLMLALNNIFIESTTYFLDPQTVVSVANVATYNTALSDAKLANHYQRGIGHLGETDMARCLRMLDQYWSPAVITGNPQATLSADYYYFTNQVATISTSASTPPSLLQDLQDITNTGDGFLWVDPYGIVHVDSRETRYTQPQSATSQFTFSDNPTDIAGGALVYTDLQYDYDPTYVYSQAQLTCDGTNDVITVVNSASATAYGQRILSKTSYFPDDWQTLQAANFYTTRYAAPAGSPGSSTPYRISSMKLAPATNPALWHAVLTLGVDDRITVTKKTAAGTVITGDYYIEQVSHNVDIASANWEVSYQLSPVWNPNPFMIGTSVLGGGATIIY